MTCEIVFRDVTEIYSRLFNHRAALQGLTNSFVKEFEEKRGDREIISLSRVLELVTDSRDRALPTTIDSLECNVDNFKDSVNKTLKLCQEIIKDSEDKKSEWLESQRRSREQQWNEFMAAQVTRSARVDSDFKNKVDALANHYADLEEKLKESTSKVL
ncbi:biogenesis of lysosome-related organelles complex 1 subunit 5 [Biomphalaria glabrata]|uniref:Biogenesis of lysosome-related organelles complex 1 subunit 5 n=1 Tax=Biomphalaria glabrata TaxID=6526 RepID=A0A9W2ZB86_BIOGL|nr:biogenesis of lysosome-related organelles complex 1 subunit 5-like [Biomphalaria glabrata]KAI8736873.1 biogenesis of lysosome-related organelles complex 1 subunit 5-like [Biomphalaria glabrata]KAI8776880.1 biogenesis of lysosome-related organelles complex 1 subunit 5 [Biomphalaria glabrata]